MHPEQQLSIARKSENATSMAVFSAVGAALEKLSLSDTPIIDINRVHAASSMFFGSVLAPWPNRLANHRYEFGGRVFSTPNVDKDGNSNHGLVFNRAFEVASQTENNLQFSYQFGSDESYPFDVDLEIKFEISDTELRVTSVARNRGSAALFGLGFHPYFLVGDKFKLTADFSEQILTDEKLIPIATKEIPGLVYNGGAMDDCFRGSSSVTLETENYSLSVNLERGFDYFMLYRPSLDCGESLLAIEPMSCVANAFNSNPDAVTLGANQEKEFVFSIKMN